MERVDGNRTVVLGLEDLSSAIELYPLISQHELSKSNGRDGETRTHDPLYPKQMR